MTEYIVISILGGLTRALLKSRSFKDLTRFDILKIIILAPIAGVLYHYFIIEWGFPDRVITFFFSYSFIDIIDKLSQLIIYKLFKK